MAKKRPIDNIEKTIYFPTDGLVIKHIVRLGSVDSKDKSRKDDLNTTDYKTKKYSNCSNVSSVYLNSSDYLVFEYIGRDRVKGERNAVFMSYPHLERVKRSLNQAFKWFSSTRYEDLFLEGKGGVLKLNKKYKDEEIYIDSLGDNSWLILKPAVVTIDEEEYQGLLLFISSQYKIVEMNFHQLLALIDFMEHFDLYQASLMLQSMAHTALNERSVEQLISMMRKGD